MTDETQKFIDHSEWQISRGGIYLASPYTHENHKVMKERVEAVTDATMALLKRGLFVFSPVVATAQLESRGEPKEGWYRYCLWLLGHFEKLWVLKLDGWDESRGIQLELAFAMGKGIQTQYIEKDDISDNSIPF